jgi:hypothetical protein
MNCFTFTDASSELVAAGQPNALFSINLFRGAINKRVQNHNQHSLYELKKIYFNTLIYGRLSQKMIFHF